MASSSQTPFSLVTSSLLLLVLIAQASRSEDDTIVVSRVRAATSFTVGELLANDASGQDLQSFSPPSRGQLERLGQTLVYRPGVNFLRHGSDSFRYRHGQEPGDLSTVFLVADLQEGLASSFAGDWPPSSSWRLETSGGNQIQIPGASTSLLIDYNGQGVAFLRYERPADTPPSSPSGGDTEMEIAAGPYSCTPPVTAGDCPHHLAAGETLVASIGGLDGAPAFEILLKPDTGGDHLLTARARQRSGVAVETRPVSLTAGVAHTIALDWWLATAPAARDGGMLLRLDGRLVAAASDLDNAGLEASVWDFGVAAENAGLAVALEINTLAIWTSDRPPAYPPLFADGGEEGHLEVWDARSRPELLAATSGAAMAGARGIEVAMPNATDLAPPYLVDRTPAAGGPPGASRYRARFHLDLADLTMPGGSLNLLRGQGETGAEKPFLIKLRQRADGAFELRAVAQQDGGTPVATPWSQLPEGIVGVPTTVELQWWAADSTGEGGLRLWVDSVLVGSPDLDNSLSRLWEIHLGAAGLPDGSAGRFHLDAFESWQ